MLGAVAIAQGHLAQGAGLQRFGAVAGQVVGPAHQVHLFRERHHAGLPVDGAGQGQALGRQGGQGRGGAGARGGQERGGLQQFLEGGGDQIGEARGGAVHEPKAGAEGLPGRHVLHASGIHAQAAGPAVLHEHFPVVPPPGQQRRQDGVQFPGLERRGRSRTPLAGPAGLPVGQQGGLGHPQRLVQVPAVVVEHPVGVQHLFGPGGLGQHALPGCRAVQPVPAHDPVQAQRLGRIHHPQRVEQVSLAALHPQGGVQHHPPGAGGQGGQGLGQAGLDERMQDRLQPGPPGRVGEHLAAQAGPVQAALRVQDLRPEGRHHLGQPLGAGGHHLPGHQVGVDHHPARCGHPGGGVALARGDAPGEPDDRIRRLGQTQVQA